MTVLTDEEIRDRNEYLWRKYQKAIGTRTSAALGFVVQARTRELAQSIAKLITRVDCKVTKISRDYWPFGRRWQVVAMSPIIPLDLIAIDHWSRQIHHGLLGLDAELTHWVPLLPGA